MVCPKIPPGPWWFVPHVKNGEKYGSTKPSKLIPQREFFDLQGGPPPAFPCKWRKQIPKDSLIVVGFWGYNPTYKLASKLEDESVVFSHPLTI